MPVRHPIAAVAATTIAVAACLAATSAAARTQAQAQAPSASATAAASTTPEHERIGRFIYAFFRAGGGDAQDLDKPGRAAGAPPGLAARAHRLAMRFDAAVEMAAAMPDAELRAILDEAAAVHAAIAAWQGTDRPPSPAP